MELDKIYADWSAKINHFQTTRHTLLALHIGAVGVLTKEFIQPSTLELLSECNYIILWIIVTFVLFFYLCAIELNLFKRVFQLSIQLMVIEHRCDSLTQAEIGYYSGRNANPSDRTGLFILGCMPETLTTVYFGALAYILYVQKKTIPAYLASAAALIFLVVLYRTFSTIRKCARNKDEREEKEVARKEKLASESI